MATAEPLKTALRKASKGLLYRSESDFPFEVFVWDKPDGPSVRDRVLRHARRRPNSPVSEVTIDAFFRSAVRERAWHGKAQKDQVKRFRTLLDVLKHHLSEIHVYKVGRVECRVYIVGKTKDDKLAGLRTMVVET